MTAFLALMAFLQAAHMQVQAVKIPEPDGTVLQAALVQPAGPPQGPAFYPGCRAPSRSKNWRPAGKLMILMGANDNWTPAAPCRQLAARFPDKIQMIVYPDSWHDFDALNRPVKVRTGLAYTAGRNGVAAAGTNKAARADAFRRVPAFIDGN